VIYFIFFRYGKDVVAQEAAAYFGFEDSTKKPTYVGPNTPVSAQTPAATTKVASSEGNFQPPPFCAGQKKKSTFFVSGFHFQPFFLFFFAGRW
jgi:hypothetical protein